MNEDELLSSISQDVNRIYDELWDKYKEENNKVSAIFTITCSIMALHMKQVIKPEYHRYESSRMGDYIFEILSGDLIKSVEGECDKIGERTNDAHLSGI